MSKVAVFIDGSNLHQCMQVQFKKTNVDLGALARKLVRDRDLLRIYYYNAPAPDDDPRGAAAQQRFFKALSYVNYLQLRLGRLLRRDGLKVVCRHCRARHELNQFDCPSCGKNSPVVSYQQKGVDTRIVVDMLTLAAKDRYDIAIVVSGDADLVEAVVAVKDELGKHVENAFTEIGWAPAMRQACDVQVRLDEAFMRDCWR